MSFGNYPNHISHWCMLFLFSEISTQESFIVGGGGAGRGSGELSLPKNCARICKNTRVSHSDPCYQAWQRQQMLNTVLEAGAKYWIDGNWREAWSILSAFLFSHFLSLPGFLFDGMNNETHNKNNTHLLVCFSVHNWGTVFTVHTWHITVLAVSGCCQTGLTHRDSALLASHLFHMNFGISPWTVGNVNHMSSVSGHHMIVCSLFSGLSTFTVVGTRSPCDC